MRAATDLFGEIGAPRPAPGVVPGDELIVDAFAGGGGASLGIEWALGRSPDIAINHDPAAMSMHTANHPATLHLPHNVWKVSLRELVGSRRIGLLWMSPDCRHHSKAKGGAPVSPSVRDLAWVLMRWLKELRPEQRPRWIFLENVEEFRKWGPLIDDGRGGRRPDPDREGETFDAWVAELKRYGYRRVEWREIRACTKGSPTIRKRLCLIAALEGEIVWPAATHGKPGSPEVVSGELAPWPVAADIIDWGRPCPSIFLTKAESKAYTAATGVRIIRPLAPKTEARIAKGVQRYVLAAAEPFIVTCNHGGDGFRGQAAGEAFRTVAAARDAHGVVIPSVVGVGGRMGQSAPRGVDVPWHTATSKADSAIVEAVAAPFVSYGQQGGASRPADEAHHTVTASRKDTNGIVVPYLVPRYGERTGQDPRTRAIDEAMPTGVPTGNGGDLAAVYLAQHNENRIGQPAGEPAPTATTRGTQTHQVAASLVSMRGRSDARDATEPLGAATGRATHAVTAAYLAQHNTDMVGHAADEAMSTLVGKGSTQGVVAAHMLSMKGSERRGGDADAPVPAVCAGGQHAAVVTLPLMTAYYSTGGQSAAIDEPSLTVTSKARFGLAEATAGPPPLSDAQLARGRQVADFLRRHGCWGGGDLVTVTVRGETYVIVDIGMRMLTPRELARAQGFPDSYILAAPHAGRVLNDTEQRHKIGNSVCPQVAAALVAANCADLAVAREAAE